MGYENEDFLGNPNKVELTDNDIEYEDIGEAGDVLWFGDEDDVDVSLDGEPLFNYLRDEGEDHWYDDNNIDDDDDDDDYVIDADDFLSDDSDGEEPRLRLVNGILVPMASNENDFFSSNSDDSQESPEENVIVINELVKTTSSIDTSTTASESDSGGDTNLLSPH